MGGSGDRLLIGLAGSSILRPPRARRAPARVDDPRTSSHATMAAGWMAPHSLKNMRKVPSLATLHETTGERIDGHRCRCCLRGRGHHSRRGQKPAAWRDRRPLRSPPPSAPNQRDKISIRKGAFLFDADPVPDTDYVVYKRRRQRFPGDAVRHFFSAAQPEKVSDAMITAAADEEPGSRARGDKAWPVWALRNKMGDARTVRHPIGARVEAFSFVSWARHRLHHHRHAQKRRAVQGHRHPGRCRRHSEIPVEDRHTRRHTRPPPANYRLEVLSANSSHCHQTP